jgi:hypothetical protein
LGVLARSAKAVSGKFRSIDFYFDRSTLSGSPNFQLFLYEICHSSLIVLQKQKTQKLAKTLENNKAKGLTNANQGVQIHHIWHSSTSSNLNEVKEAGSKLSKYEQQSNVTDEAGDLGSRPSEVKWKRRSVSAVRDMLPIHGANQPRMSMELRHMLASFIKCAIGECAEIENKEVGIS